MVPALRTGANSCAARQCSFVGVSASCHHYYRCSYPPAHESLPSAFGEAGERVCGSVPPFPAKSSGPTLTTNDASTRPKEQGGSHGQECPLYRDRVGRDFLDSIGRRPFFSDSPVASRATTSAVSLEDPSPGCSNSTEDAHLKNMSTFDVDEHLRD